MRNIFQLYHSWCLRGSPRFRPRGPTDGMAYQFYFSTRSFGTYWPRGMLPKTPCWGIVCMHACQHVSM